MSSLPIAPVSSTTNGLDHLLAVFENVDDPRGRRGRCYSLPTLMGAGLAATIAGAKTFTEIGEWIAQAPRVVLTQLGVRPGACPEQTTIARLYRRVDAQQLDRALNALIWTRSTRVDTRRVISADGKTLRGAATPTGLAPHLVAACDQASGVVLGQVAVDDKSNEIPALQTLLDAFDLSSVVVTADAMHTQTQTAQLILDADGDYVFTVKGNQPTLYAQLKNMQWRLVRPHISVSVGHGKQVRRTHKILQAPNSLDWPGVKQVVQIHRKITTKCRKTRTQKTTHETVYVITSADAQTAPPATLAAWIQNHWHIENRIHWVRDVTFNEDKSQIRTGNAPHVMATLRNITISLLRLAGYTNIAKALRHHARNPHRPLKLLKSG